MKMKQCTKCKKTKALSEFNKNKNFKDSHDYWCKTCRNKYDQKYREEHQDKRCKSDQKQREKNREENRIYARKHRLSKYGITLKEYDLMLKLQGNGCAVCGRSPEENGQRLAVDHDHETGGVRELLCRECNLALGLLNDSPKRCDLLRTYLQKHGK